VKAEQYPEFGDGLNKDNLLQCKEQMENLQKLSRRYTSSNLVMKFLQCREMKSLMDEATRVLQFAVSTLHLDLSTASLQVNLNADKKFDGLLDYIDMRDGKVIVVLENMVSEFSKHNASLNKREPSRRAILNSPSASEEMSSNLLILPEGTVQDTNSLQNPVFEDDEILTLSDGKIIDENVCQEMEYALKRFKILPSHVKKVNCPLLGKGAFSKVFKIEHEEETRALKVFELEEGISAEDRKRVYLTFSNELYMLSKLQHERIIKFHGYYSTVGEVALVVEYMDGGSLWSLLRDTSRWTLLTPKHRHQILVDTAEGMNYLHENQVAHSDLKSLNILIKSNFRAKLADFGISKICNTLTSTQSVGGGTNAWLAPEGFQGGEIDRFKADAYSYGVLIWEVMAGRLGNLESTPWRGLTAPQIMYSVCNGKRPTLEQECICDSNVCDASNVVDTMNYCLEHDPEKRLSFSEICTFISP
jgi:predicted Ser/Thr protein kinase